ncbi:hypothetical protein ACFE04_026932 [Oxalis oulophora]
MACATTRPTFSFHLLSKHPPPKPHYTSQPLMSPKLTPPLIILHSKSQTSKLTSIHSIDVSQEDTPTLDQSEPLPELVPEEEIEGENFDKRRLEEKFAVLNTGIYECRSCGFNYDESVGDPSYPIPPGFNFGKLPEDWRCPTCGAAKSFFESKSVEIAGFAQNQQYGLGGNSLTEGQKALLIYGQFVGITATNFGSPGLGDVTNGHNVEEVVKLGNIYVNLVGWFLILWNQQHGEEIFSECVEHTALLDPVKWDFTTANGQGCRRCSLVDVAIEYNGI